MDDEEEVQLCTKPGCEKVVREGHKYCVEHFKEQEDYNYGMDGDVSKKIAAKFDIERANQAQTWIEELIGEKFTTHLQGALLSGVVLCKLINVISPGVVPQIHNSDKAFHHRENIAAYLKACRKLRMRETDLFVSQDLYEGDNMIVVLDNLFALSALSQHPSINFRGPHLEKATNYLLGEAKEVEEPKFLYDEYTKGKVLNIQHDKYRIDVGIRTYQPKADDKKCKAQGCKEGCQLGKDLCLEHFKQQENFDYGIAAEVKAVMRDKLTAAGENVDKARQWIKTITGEEVGENLQESLKSGVILCKLVNAIKPGSVGKIHTMNAPFKQRDNIANYLDACKKLGQPEGELFVTEDLFEGTNLVLVVNQVMGLGGLAQRIPEFKGPHLGVARQETKKDQPPKWEVREMMTSYRGTRLYSDGDSLKKRSSSSLILDDIDVSAAAAAAVAAAAKADAIFCSECGKQREDPEGVFCDDCGAKYDL